MAEWSHVVIEGFCDEENGRHPCGKSAVSDFCLLKGGCPHFHWAGSNEREAAQFVPLRLIVEDKLRNRLSELYWWSRWLLWDKWRYDPSWIERVPIAECPPVHGQVMDNARRQFPEWLKKVGQG